MQLVFRLWRHGVTAAISFFFLFYEHAGVCTEATHRNTGNMTSGSAVLHNTVVGKEKRGGGDNGNWRVMN